LLQLSQKERIPQSPDDPQWLWEEGGFAKGLALDRIQEQLQRELSDPLQAGLKVSLNFGGQILHCGSGRKQVILGRPQFRNERTLEFWVQNESVSTSGQIEKPGHIIDPKTGLSAPDLGTATALHSSSELADMVSTALLVMGPAQAKKWWDKVSGDGELASLEWIWIERSGVITATCGLKTRHLISYADSSKIHWLGNCLTKSQ
jgi:hypothetical protein